MKRRYKLLLIIVMGISLTILINVLTMKPKFYLTALGDGVALGVTSYQVVGLSFNDYLKDYYENKNEPVIYNHEFTEDSLTMEELKYAIKENKMGEESAIPLKQIIAKSNLVTLAIGMDEIVDYQLKDKLNDKRIEDFLNDYNLFLKEIRTFYKNDLLVIGLYPTYNLDQNTVFSINKELQKIAANNSCKFIDITALALNPKYYSDNTSYYMNYKGHKAIYKIIRKSLSV